MLLQVQADHRHEASSKSLPELGQRLQLLSSRAVILFRKCRMTSRATGPRGSVSSARTLSRRLRTLEALSKDRVPKGFREGAWEKLWIEEQLT